MRFFRYTFLLLLVTIISTSCSTTGLGRNSSSSDLLDISFRGAIGRIEAAYSGPMYTGDGGSNIRLAILAPEIQGDVPAYLPLYIQGLLNDNINRFSAINLIDRQNLNRIISEQNLTTNGRFSDRDFISIGNITNAQFLLFGTIQRLSGNRFSLQFSITESSTGIVRATFMQQGALSQLEGRVSLLNEATADLLRQMGVQLTEGGLQLLLEGNISTVQAQTGLARGITAQSDGSEVEALLNYAQAVSFDPSQLEALSRLNTLSTNISGGTISQRILNDIHARDRWLEVFKETTRFFDEHPPFELFFDPNLIQIGEINYSRRTATLGMRIALDPSDSGFYALNALLEGLEHTGRRNVWGFNGWPLRDISPRISGTVVFGRRRSFSCRVEVAIINENGRTIGTSNITLDTGTINFISGQKVITPPNSVEDTIRFNNIRVDDLTPTLTIMIVSVNSIRSRELATTGYMRIEPVDLERRFIERASAERLIREQHETAQLERERREALSQLERERQHQLERERYERERQSQLERERYERELQRRITSDARKDNAERNFFGISGYYQWSNINTSIIGIEANYYFNLLPHISMGLDFRFGIFSINDYDNMKFILSPNIGLVYPFGNNFKIFSDVGLEIGDFGLKISGIIFDSITPVVNFGILLQSIPFRYLLRYRATWYRTFYDNIFYSSAISIGIGF